MAGQPSFPPVADVAKLEFRLTAGGVFAGIQCQYEVYWRDTVATRNFAYLSALAQDAQDAWAIVGGVADITPDDWTLNSCRAIDLDTTTHLSADSNGTVGIGGTAATLPLTVAAVVRIPNTEGGAPKRPYVRHTPLFEADVAGNTIAGAAMTAITSAWEASLADLAASQPDGELVVVSVYEPKASGGGTPATLYRAAGLVKVGGATALSVRPLVGRASSRQK